VESPRGSVESPRETHVLPLRPLTTGELLDAAVGLLRDNARALLAVALGLAAAEQAALYPLRRTAGIGWPTSLVAHSDRLAEYWLVIAVGCATEAAVIALLGGLAAQAARAAVADQRLPARALLSPRGTAPGSVVAVAVVAGTVCGLAALCCLAPWIFAYGLLGLAVPAVVIDGRRPPGALIRSIVLAARGGLRACWIRIIGYLGWLAIRAALGFGCLAALDYVLPAGRWTLAAGAAVWVGVDAVAYATLACLDAVLHLETRMRTEGLDIVAVRARGQGQPVPLAVPR